MKTVILGVAVVLILSVMQSCKKDWVCQCVNTSANITTDSIINQETQLSAKAKCKTFEATLPLGNTVCSLQ